MHDAVQIEANGVPAALIITEPFSKIVNAFAPTIGAPFLTPSVQALISRRSDPERQGEVLGVNQSFSALARILEHYFAAVDLPVAGDPLYGRAGELGLERQFLHAARLAFPHPITGEQVDVSSALPPDLAQALATLRA